VIKVYEYGKPPSYPGPDVFYCSNDTPGNNPWLRPSDKDFKIPKVHQPSSCNCVDCRGAQAREELQPIVAKYRVVQNEGSSTSTATVTDELSDERSSPSDERSSPATPGGGTVIGFVHVPTVVRSMAELQEMDPEMAAFVTENDARDVRCAELAAADSCKGHQVNEMGELKQDEHERVRRKRACDTRALSPLHCCQLKCPPPWLDSCQPHAAALDRSHARSHSAPRTSSRLSGDTRVLSPMRPQFRTSNKVVPVYSHVLASIDSGASMTMTPHASLIREAQQCNMSIKLADGSVLKSNIKRGFLNAACNGKLLPKIEALHVPDLAATLISSLQLVSEGNMDMVHSKHCSPFMQREIMLFIGKLKGRSRMISNVHATCMQLLSNLHATCGQDHDCNYCNRHEHLNNDMSHTRFSW